MKNSTNASIIIIIFSFILLISFNTNYEVNYQNFCKNDLNCITKLINETGNFSLCNNLNNKSKCYYFITFKYKNPNLCNYTKNISNCYINYAINFNNTLLCNKTNKQTECIYKIANTNKNYKICEQANNNILCYYSYAIKHKNKTICNYTQKYKKTCIHNILNETN